MPLTTVRYACHTAHLAPFTGEGVLVLPLPSHDMHMTGPSLHASDWEAVAAGVGRRPTYGKHPSVHWTWGRRWAAQLGCGIVVVVISAPLVGSASGIARRLHLPTRCGGPLTSLFPSQEPFQR